MVGQPQRLAPWLLFGAASVVSLVGAPGPTVLARLFFLAVLASGLSSPNYISLLWTDSLGNLMLVGSAIWMSMGIFVMRKMINFDF